MVRALHIWIRTKPSCDTPNATYLNVNSGRLIANVQSKWSESEAEQEQRRKVFLDERTLWAEIHHRECLYCPGLASILCSKKKNPLMLSCVFTEMNSFNAGETSRHRLFHNQGAQSPTNPPPTYPQRPSLPPTHPPTPQSSTPGVWKLTHSETCKCTALNKLLLGLFIEKYILCVISQHISKGEYASLPKLLKIIVIIHRTYIEFSVK